MIDYTYIGGELELFATANHWKSLLAAHLGPWIGAEVLEVGSGIGSTTKVLIRPEVGRWVCLEPDARLADHLTIAIQSGTLVPRPELRIGTLESIREDEFFDTILYVDVLEHIEDDRGELDRAARHLKPSGVIVVLSPAHQWLFTPFDRAIGHYRRYSKRSIRSLTPDGTVLVSLKYLDSIGLFASLGNRLLLRKAMPSRAQVAFWDREVVPISTVVDPLLRHSAGKSILAVWRKSPALQGPTIGG